MAKVETREIEVLDKGIHCSGCESRIQGVLGKLPGVQKVKASHKTQKIVLELDPERASIQQMREKLEDIGYKTARQP